MKLKHPQYMDSAWRQLPDTNVAGYFQIHTDKTATVRNNGTLVSFATSVGPAGEVIVAPHGTLFVSGYGGRDTDWRHDIRCLLGVDFDLAKEFVGKLFCPHTKQKVPVSRIVDNPVLWCDREHGVALVAGRVTYASPDSPPAKEKEERIRYSVINRKRVKEFMPRWKRLVNEAKVRISMMSSIGSHLSITTLLRELALSPDVVDIESVVRISQQRLSAAATDDLERTAQVCRTIANNCVRDDLKELISFACADQYESPYLEYHP
jgi:hypothetical protein